MAQVKIGAHEVEIKLEDTDLADDCGRSNYDNNRITIYAKNARTQQEESLIHETLHFMNHSIDHPLLDSLAEQLYAFLKENGLLNQEKLNELLQ